MKEWISGDTATGVVMKRRKQRLEDNCPRCKEPHEHLLHVLVCKDSNTGAFRKGEEEEFQIWLQKENIEPNLERFLTLGLQSWIDDPMGREPEYVVHSQKWEKAVTTQVNLGWYAFLCGFVVAKPLIDIQHDHYLELQLKKKAERWAIKLIHKSWNIMYQLWTQRNTALHETDAIHENSGVALLKAAIMREYELGKNNLPRVYSQNFTQTLENILEKSVTQQKQWFLVIRSGKEGMILDSFSDEDALRHWIGLTPR
eukprot:scaffold1897_cov236-Chaetoceros_neogracile.AAC.2